jgi:hypothetical protein
MMFFLHMFMMMMFHYRLFVDMVVFLMTCVPVGVLALTKRLLVMNMLGLNRFTFNRLVMNLFNNYWLRFYNWLMMLLKAIILVFRISAMLSDKALPVGIIHVVIVNFAK